jgi:predicted GIY-YIG superfamily endonuclease
LVYKEVHPTKKAAYAREKQIKSYKGGKASKELLAKNIPNG